MAKGPALGALLSLLSFDNNHNDNETRLSSARALNRLASLSSVKSQLACAPGALGHIVKLLEAPDRRCCSAAADILSTLMCRDPQLSDFSKGTLLRHHCLIEALMCVLIGPSATRFQEPQATNTKVELTRPLNTPSSEVASKGTLDNESAGQRDERLANTRDNTRKATISRSQRKQSQRFEADRVTKLKIARVLVELARDQGNKTILARNNDLLVDVFALALDQCQGGVQCEMVRLLVNLIHLDVATSHDALVTDQHRIVGSARPPVSVSATSVSVSEPRPTTHDSSPDHNHPLRQEVSDTGNISGRLCHAGLLEVMLRLTDPARSSLSIIALEVEGWYNLSCNAELHSQLLPSDSFGSTTEQTSLVQSNADTQRRQSPRRQKRSVHFNQFNSVERVQYMHSKRRASPTPRDQCPNGTHAAEAWQNAPMSNTPQAIRSETITTQDDGQARKPFASETNRTTSKPSQRRCNELALKRHSNGRDSDSAEAYI
jgi:hypothetical protein